MRKLLSGGLPALGSRRLRATVRIVLCQIALVANAADQVVEINATQEKALGIETAALIARSGGEMGGLAAQVAVPNSQMHLVAAPVVGLVERIPVAVNGSVRTGEVLARILSPALAELQRGYVQASVQAQLAADNLQRDEARFRDGIIEESRLRATRGQHAEAGAALAERKQALRLAGVPDGAIARLATGQGLGAAIEVRAPADGVILEQMVAVGARVEVAAAMFRVAKLEPLWLEIQVPVGALGRIRVGAAASVPAAQATGRIISIGRSADANQTVRVRAEITRGAGSLMPGQVVEAVIAAGDEQARGAFSIPSAAVVRVDGRSLVFVRTARGFAAMPVTVTGEAAAESSATVTGAFRGDERIAVRGVAALKARLTGIGGE